MGYIILKNGTGQDIYIQTRETKISGSNVDRTKKNHKKVRHNESIELHPSLGERNINEIIYCYTELGFKSYKFNEKETEIVQHEFREEKC